MNNKLLELQYKLLGHEGLGFTEFRILDMTQKGRVLETTMVKGQKEFISRAKELLEQYPDMGIFVGLNPRKDNTKKGDLDNIKSVNIIMIDLDPVRPVGQGSTDEQHTEAIKFGSEVALANGNAILADSGSGAHVYIPIIPIVVENPKELTKSCKHYHNSLILKYAKTGFKIDSTHDLPRVTRLWGSYNSKSKRWVKPILNNYETITEFSRSDLSFSQEKTSTELVKTSVGESRITGYEDRFNTLTKIHPGISSIMACKSDFKSPSEANFAFVSYLVKAHFKPSEIKSLVKLNPLGQSENKTEEQMDKDVDRIIDKIRGNGIGSLSFVQTGERYYAGLSKRGVGLASGIKKLDDLLAGFQKGRMYVNAARTNEGKTSLSCQLGYQFAKSGQTVVYFPTELGYEPLFDKLVAGYTNINLRKFQSGSFSDEERERIGRTKEELSQLSFVVHENFALTVQDIERVVREVAPGVIIIDFIQAMKYEEGGTPREISANIRKIKELTDTYRLVTILNSQLSRAAIGAEVNLSQLKGSGAIEEFADVVMALATLSKTEYPRPMDLHILKSRYSEIGKIRLDFYSSVGRFEEHHED